MRTLAFTGLFQGRKCINDLPYIFVKATNHFVHDLSTLATIEQITKKYSFHFDFYGHGCDLENRPGSSV